MFAQARLQNQSPPTINPSQTLYLSLSLSFPLSPLPFPPHEDGKKGTGLKHLLDELVNLVTLLATRTPLIEVVELSLASKPTAR